LTKQRNKNKRNKIPECKINKVTLIAIIVLVLVICISLLLSCFIFEEHMVLSEGFFLVAGSAYSLLFSLILLLFTSKMVKVIDKILVPLFMVVSLFFSIKFAFSAAQLFLDKQAYDIKNFKVVKGIPSKVTYDGSKSSPDYVDTITIQDTKVEVSHLFILEKDFNKKLKNKPLKIEYLPISKYVMSVEEYHKNVKDDN
jgi:hypothetical protein